jgi:hypothetical protein
MTHGVVANIVPLFTIALGRAQRVIEKLFLPDKTRYAKLTLDPFADPFVPKPHEDCERLPVKFWPAEKMHVIRHNDITANRPAVTRTRRAPFAD